MRTPTSLDRERETGTDEERPLGYGWTLAFISLGAVIGGVLGTLLILAGGIGPGEGNGVRKLPPAPSSSIEPEPTRAPLPCTPRETARATTR